ncbi:hypothetical protein [Candidatus Cardinium sp. cBcalN2]|uniref:hypothetical protein n=1 Tax=Candidatus Cardinium sp. cBcalN2 TaxID=2699436 RepID=UPI001FB2DD69|nr:hypothetical protein [Candidatus Cardinium sp. cBcalN2]
MQQPSKSLKIAGSGEWKSTKWNIGEAAVNKKHHNWHKIFGDKKPTLKEIDPYVKEALTKGKWTEVRSIMTKRNKGVVTGTKMKLVHQVGEHKIWVLGKKTLDGELIINNAGVE